MKKLAPAGDVLKRVGIWIRVSAEDQARGESPERHEQRARALASAKGWEIATVYDLSGVSGKTVMEHPECKRMLKDVASGAISALVFSKLARLARNTKELLEFAEYFGGHDADLVSLGDPPHSPSWMTISLEGDRPASRSMEERLDQTKHDADRIVESNRTCHRIPIAL